MNKIRLLIAASRSIASTQWLSSKLAEALPDEGVELRVYGSNAALISVVASSGRTYRAPMVERDSKQGVRRALAAVDHLLVFWDGRDLNTLLFEARLLQKPTKVVPRETTVVANKDRGDPFDVYIGRGTPWGNPFVVGSREGQFDRETAIALYREHFQKNILGVEERRRELHMLRGYRLGCHCKPLACHGDVIAAYLNNIDDRESSLSPESAQSEPTEQQLSTQ